jgi:branched-chain amino acid transport system permease protein
MFWLNRIGVITLLIFAAVLPLFVGDYNLHVALYTIWFIYLCLAWNISAMTGMICIAHTCFLGIGAYLPALLFIHLGISPWFGMMAGMLGAAVLALILFYLPFRLGLPPLSFVIYTLALVFITYHVALGSTILGRDWGLHLFFRADDPANFQWQSKLPYYYLLLVMTFGGGAVNRMILKSKVGLFFRAIKDNERVAAAAGINIVRYKLLASIISAGLIAPAGIFWGMYSRFVDPETLLSVHLPIKICLYTVIGGVGTFWGPIIGAATLAPLTELIRGAMGARYAGGDLVLIGAIIIVILVVMRRGVAEWVNLRRLRTKMIPGKSAHQAALSNLGVGESLAGGFDEKRGDAKVETSLLHWYYRKTIDTLFYEGFYILLWRMLKWCLSPLGYLDMMTFYRRDLTQPLTEKSAKVDLSVIQATEADMDQLTAMVARRYGPTMVRLWPYKNQSIRDILQQRFQEGCKCFVAKVGTEMIHYNWIFFYWEEAVMGTVRSRLQADEAICNDAFTEEAWRGKGVHDAVHNYMLRHLQQEGYQCVYTSAGTDNRSSQKALHRHNWTFYGKMLYFIPRGSEQGWVWRIKGSVEPASTEQIHGHKA